MRKSCGKYLSDYEDCWPAEAVTREALTATRRGRGAVEPGSEEEDDADEAPRKPKRKTVCRPRARSRARTYARRNVQDDKATRRSVRVRKHRIVESEDEEKMQSKPPRKRKNVSAYKVTTRIETTADAQKVKKGKGKVSRTPTTSEDEEEQTPVRNDTEKVVRAKP